MNVPFLHPSDRDLVRVATGELPVSESTSVSSHLVSCQRCRSYVQDVRAMASASNATEAPRASAALLSRIVVERTVGARVIIAGEDVLAPPRRSLGRRLLVGIGTAAVLVFSTLTVRRVRTEIGTVPSTGARTAIGSASNFGYELSVWPSVVSAQTLGAPRQAPYAPVRILAASRLAPGPHQYVFSSSIARDSLQVRPYALLSDELRSTRYRGEPAWELASTNSAYPVRSRRTVLVRAFDLNVIESRWETDNFVQVIHATDSSVIVRFMAKRGAYTDDSAHAAHRVAVSSGELPRLPGRPLAIGDAGLRLLFRVLPLHVGWRGSVDLISYESPFLDHIRPIYVNLRVTTQVLVTSSYRRRRIPCWRVLVDAGGAPEYWYISRQSGELIRAERKNEDGSAVEVDQLDAIR